MPVRKLMISRGLPDDAPVPLHRARPTLVAAAPPPADPHLVHHRLEALERLVRIRDHGGLTAEEFAAEKALVLGLPASEPDTPRRSPTLTAFLLDWRLLSAGIAAGLAISYATAPQDLLGLLDRAARLLG